MRRKSAVMHARAFRPTRARAAKSTSFLVLVVLIALAYAYAAVIASEGVFNDASRSLRWRSPLYAAVLTATWSHERVLNAQRICEFASTIAEFGCVIKNATVIDEDAARAIEARGYIERFEAYEHAESDLGWTPRRVIGVMMRPLKFYAHKSADRRKVRLYERAEDRTRRAGSIGNLALFGILAQFVSEPTVDSSTIEQSLVRTSDDLWPDVGEALERARERDRTYQRSSRSDYDDSILLFEDDANVVSPSPDALRSELMALIQTLPTGWDILSLDPHPNFCREPFWKHPSAPTSLKRRVHRTYSTFSRTTAIVVSRRGALKILRNLPTNIVIDMFIARILRQGGLRIYLACDNGIVRQVDSSVTSLGG